MGGCQPALESNNSFLSALEEESRFPLARAGVSSNRNRKCQMKLSIVVHFLQELSPYPYILQDELVPEQENLSGKWKLSKSVGESKRNLCSH